MMEKFILITGREADIEEYPTLDKLLVDYKDRLSWGTRLVVAQVIPVSLVSTDIDGNRAEIEFDNKRGE